MCGINLSLVCHSGLKQIERSVIKAAAPISKKIIPLAIITFAVLAAVLLAKVLANWVEKNRRFNNSNSDDLLNSNHLRSGNGIPRSKQNNRPMNDETTLTPVKNGPKNKKPENSNSSKDDKPSSRTISDNEDVNDQSKNPILNEVQETLLENGDYTKKFFEKGSLVKEERKNNGIIRVGTFDKNGNLQGKGEITFPNGTVEVGFFKDDKLHGKGKRKIANNKGLQIGDFLTGCLDGKGIKIYADGKEEDGTFSVGVLKVGNVIEYPFDKEQDRLERLARKDKLDYLGNLD